MQLETRRQSEHLSVIEPAERSEQPFIDARKHYLALGGLISAIVASALAVMAELRNPVIRTAAQMRRVTGIVPIIAVPHVDLARPGNPRLPWRLLAALRRGARPI